MNFNHFSTGAFIVFAAITIGCSENEQSAEDPEMSELKRITYRGVPMIEGWPERIQEAQLQTTYSIEGTIYPRVRYGDESTDWHADNVACHDCRVIKCEFHVVDCDVEECPRCGEQAISCDCSFDENW